MELLHLIPYDVFRHMESSLRSSRFTMPQFVDTVMEGFAKYKSSALQQPTTHGGGGSGMSSGSSGLEDSGDLGRGGAVSSSGGSSGAGGGRITRRMVQEVFHEVDIHGKGRIGWDQLTMFLIDDTVKGAPGASALSEGAAPHGELGHLELHQVVKQPSASSRVRALRYVPAWDRTLRVIQTSLRETMFELSSPGRFDAPTKFSKPVPSELLAMELVPEMNSLVSSYRDMTCAVHTVQVGREGPNASSIPLARSLSHTEMGESSTALLWHPALQTLFSGFRSGTIAAWNLRLDKPSENGGSSKGPIGDRLTLFDQSISAMLPFESHKLVVASSRSTNNICLYDFDKQSIIDVFRGHTCGVSALAQGARQDLFVSAGFERVPYVWMLKVKDFPPWRLIDKAEPHQGDITSLHCPTPFRLISSDDRGTVKVWDIRTLRCVQTVTGDQPTFRGKLTASGPTVAHSSVSSQYFHSLSYNSTNRSLLSCGPSTITTFKAVSPTSLHAVDDKALTGVAFVSTKDTLLTAHRYGVKTWSMQHGAMLFHFPELVHQAPGNHAPPNDISAICLDHRERKMYLGTRNGEVIGYCVNTGSLYRTFRAVGGEVRALTYGALRNGTRCLIGATSEELFYSDDTTTDGRQHPILQPIQQLRLAIHRFATQGAFTEEESEHRSKRLVYRGVAAHSKLSVILVWFRWYVVILDMYSLSMIHILPVDHNEVVHAVFLGDLGAVAVLDSDNVLHIYAIRPSNCAGNRLARRELSQVSEGSLDPRARQTLMRSRRATVRRQSEIRAANMRVREFVHTDDAAAGSAMYSVLSFHQESGQLFVGDGNGTVWIWDLNALIAHCKLIQSIYPVPSAKVALERLRTFEVTATSEESRDLIRLAHTFQAHNDEIYFLRVVFSQRSSKLLTAGADLRVKCWTLQGSAYLGELSQGRLLQVPLGEEAKTQLFYDRNAIRPWIVPPPDQLQSPLSLPWRVAVILRRYVARFLEVRDRHRAAHNKRGKQQGANEDEEDQWPETSAQHLATVPPLQPALGAPLDGTAAGADEGEREGVGEEMEGRRPSAFPIFLTEEESDTMLDDGVFSETMGSSGAGGGGGGGRSHSAILSDVAAMMGVTSPPPEPDEPIVHGKGGSLIPPSPRLRVKGRRGPPAPPLTQQPPHGGPPPTMRDVGSFVFAPQRDGSGTALSLATLNTPRRQLDAHVQHVMKQASASVVDLGRANEVANGARRATSQAVARQAAAHSATTVASSPLPSPRGSSFPFTARESEHRAVARLLGDVVEPPPSLYSAKSAR